MHTSSPAGNPTTASQQKGDSADVGNVIKPHSAPAGDARTPDAKVRRDWCEEHNRGSLAETDGLCPECEERSAKRQSARPPDTPAPEPSEAAMTIARGYIGEWQPMFREQCARDIDAFAARAVEAAIAKERVRCLNWAAGSAHTAQYVIDGIESGRDAP